MSYTVIVPKPVQKQLDRLPDDVRDRIIEKIVALAENPRPQGVIKLKGYDREYRIRIGDYRVRYEIDDEESVVVLLHCQHRRDVYRN
ncbi:MAG: type II toxin-antitoxin system RelE/ParE family toxin [Hormoscilla sp. GUM202]|nr:type II toxin-antitoxin system RelE/ParE family toxin [Hormoscilla sp. GUM202]